MNRGFGYYFREGVSASAKSLFRDKNYFRYIGYFFMALIGRITLLFNVLFDLANVRQGRIVRKEKRVDVSQSFREAGRASAVWTYLLTVCVEGLMTLAGILMIGVVTCALAAIGLGISTLSENLNSYLFMAIFAAPGAIVLVVYLAIVPLIFAPTPYIVANNPGIGVGDTLSSCFRTMKTDGKLTLFLNVFVSLAIKLLCLAFFAGCGYLIWDALRYENILSLALILWNVFALAVYALIAPIFTLATRAANNHLFEDIVLDPVAAERKTSGINIKHCKGQKFEAGTEGENLAALFDESEPDFDEAEKTEQPIPNAASVFAPIDLNNAYQTTRKDIVRTVAPQPAPEPATVPAPAVQQPVSEPAVQQPAFVPEPVTAEPVAEAEPVAAEPVTEPIAEEPIAAPEPIMEEPAAVAEEPEQFVEEPVVEAEPVAEESEQLAEEPVVEAKPIAEEEEPIPTVGTIIGETETVSEPIDESAAVDPEPSAEESAAVSEPIAEEPEAESGSVAEDVDPIEAEFPDDPETPKPVKKKSASASKLISRLKKSK